LIRSLKRHDVGEAYKAKLILIEAKFIPDYLFYFDKIPKNGKLI
jgi:hypothetical protein